jgi:hypothetical protein
VFPLNLYAHVRFVCTVLHMRPRVQRAPGLPCALSFQGEDFKHNSGESRRENANAYPRAVILRSEPFGEPKDGHEPVRLILRGSPAVRAHREACTSSDNGEAVARG